jgi:hypothetical protein
MPGLLLGGGTVDRLLPKPAELLAAYLEDEGTRYLNQVPITPADRLLPEDLAVTLLINSQVGYRAYKSVQDFGPALDFSVLPAVTLEETTESQRGVVAGFIGEVAQWSGFATSVATKVLHKKRPALIPLLDNQAIFGAYMNPKWPASRSPADSIRDVKLIREALERIAVDLTRPDNATVWPVLHDQEPARSRLELFDMIWWVHFRSVEPVQKAGSKWTSAGTMPPDNHGLF